MTFPEIFKKDGLYVADSFRSGFCLEVLGGALMTRQYESKSDLLPVRDRALMFAGLLDKDYTKVLNKNQLFNE